MHDKWLVTCFIRIQKTKSSYLQIFSSSMEKRGYVGAVTFPGDNNGKPEVVQHFMWQT